MRFLAHSAVTPEIPVPRPWMDYNRTGWLLCLMCPIDKTTRQGAVQYYRGINTKRKTRDQIYRWVHTHRRCGFEGLR